MPADPVLSTCACPPVHPAPEARDLVPVCGWCGKVRTRAGRWVTPQLEDARTGLPTHGVCPDCAAVIFPRRRTAA